MTLKFCDYVVSSQCDWRFLSSPTWASRPLCVPLHVEEFQLTRRVGESISEVGTLQLRFEGQRAVSKRGGSEELKLPRRGWLCTIPAPSVCRPQRVRHHVFRTNRSRRGRLGFCEVFSKEFAVVLILTSALWEKGFGQLMFHRIPWTQGLSGLFTPHYI